MSRDEDREIQHHNKQTIPLFQPQVRLPVMLMRFLKVQQTMMHQNRFSLNYS